MKSGSIPADMDTIDNGDVWVPLLEAAQILGKSQWSLYTLVRNGHVESRRSGHRIYVELESVCTYYELRELEKQRKMKRGI